MRHEPFSYVALALLAFTFTVGDCLLAQQTRRSGLLEERFKQLDKNGDSVVTFDEAKEVWSNRPSRAAQ